jgi:hypothetical protein
VDTLLYFIGVIIAIFVAIYFMDTAHRIQDGTLVGKRQGMPPSRGSPKGPDAPKPSYPRPKICPVCGAHLEPHDVLVATMFDEKTENGRQRVLIHGCKYCHKREGKAGSAEGAGGQVVEL